MLINFTDTDTRQLKITGPAIYGRTIVYLVCQVKIERDPIRPTDRVLFRVRPVAAQVLDTGGIVVQETPYNGLDVNRRPEWRRVDDGWRVYAPVGERIGTQIYPDPAMIRSIAAVSVNA